MTDPRKFTSAVADEYMSPYQKKVTEVLKEEARRDAALTRSGRAMGSIDRGTFGGARDALISSEADRNLQTQLKLGIKVNKTLL